MRWIVIAIPQSEMGIPKRNVCAPSLALWTCEGVEKSWSILAQTMSVEEKGDCHQKRDLGRLKPAVGTIAPINKKKKSQNRKTRALTAACWCFLIDERKRDRIRAWIFQSPTSIFSFILIFFSSYIPDTSITILTVWRILDVYSVARSFHSNSRQSCKRRSVDRFEDLKSRFFSGRYGHHSFNGRLMGHDWPTVWSSIPKSLCF